MSEHAKNLIVGLTGPDPANKSLLTAVLGVQSEAPTLPKDGINPAFGGSKFTTLTKITETIGPILSKHGLVWMTLPGGTKEAPSLRYSLLHPESGEGIHGDMPLMLSKADAQGLGSALTYARRYSLCAVLNLVADDDDDGNGASTHTRASSDLPSPAQLKELGRQVKMAKPTTAVLREMLKVVEADGVTEEELENGLWSTKVSRAQVSGLLDMFKEGKLPTGQSDIPADDPPQASPVGDDGDLPEALRE